MTHALPPNTLHHLRAHGQEHLLAGWDALSPGDRAALVDQLAGIDLTEMEALYRRKDEPHAVLPPRDRISPLPVEPPTDAARGVGEEALRRGGGAAPPGARGPGAPAGVAKPEGG